MIFRCILQAVKWKVCLKMKKMTPFLQKKVGENEYFN